MGGVVALRYDSTSGGWHNSHHVTSIPYEGEETRPSQSLKQYQWPGWLVREMNKMIEGGASRDEAMKNIAKLIKPMRSQMLGDDRDKSCS